MLTNMLDLYPYDSIKEGLILPCMALYFFPRTQTSVFLRGISSGSPLPTAWPTALARTLSGPKYASKTLSMIRASWSLSPTSIYCPVHWQKEKGVDTRASAARLYDNCLRMTFCFSGGPLFWPVFSLAATAMLLLLARGHRGFICCWQ